MEIGIAALAFSTLLAFGGHPFLFLSESLTVANLKTLLPSSAIRWMLVRKNKQLDEDEQGALKEANRERIEEAARLEGITFEEAMERKRGFRYLY